MNLLVLFDLQLLRHADRRVFERHVAHILFTGVEATHAQVEFGPQPTVHQWTLGADAETPIFQPTSRMFRSPRSGNIGRVR